MDEQRNEPDPMKYCEGNSDINHRSSESDTQREETIYGGNLICGGHTDEDDDGGLIKRVKKRVHKFSDSESDDEKENKVNISLPKSSSSDSEHDSDLKINKSKRRLKIHSQMDRSDSESSSNEGLKNEQQQLRMKNKKNKLKEKFKSLVTSRLSESQVEKQLNSHSGNESDSKRSDEDKPGNSQSESESNSDDKGELGSGGSDLETSVERMKWNIKEKTSSYKTTICDPDTSDEESHSTAKSVLHKKKERKTTKLTSPKPVRMTAKQAMENMKKIKSESNRMLREKEVTLPYHRPKALSLKDIMSRRRPAVSSDGKSLPIKMNEEQLRQYAKQLEERQKEMMELCKSDTDEDLDEGETQPEQSKESEKTHEPENSEQTEPNQELKVPESMETDDIKESSDNTSVKTKENLSSHVDEDERTDNVDNTSAENEHNMEVTENRSDNTLVEADNNYATVETNSVEAAAVAGSKIDNNSREKANDSVDSNASNAEMSLVYNDSIEEGNILKENTEAIFKNEDDNVAACKQTAEKGKETEADSQLVSLHYDTEKSEINSDNIDIQEVNELQPSTSHDASDIAFDEVCKENEFSDDDMINMEDIDNLIENAEILKDNNDAVYANSPMLINDPVNSKIQPKLTGGPGMVIDLDGTDAIARKKLTGLELLKERYTYFAKLKTPEELEREKEKRLKPGAQHLKLKHELEEQIAEQRSLEWAKRLEEEKQHQLEMNVLRGDDSEDDIEKIEAKLEEKEEPEDAESSESEESEEEMQEVEEKPRKRNPMIDDEAEESDVEEDPNDGDEAKENDEGEKQENDTDNDPEDNNDEDSEDSSESSESEEEMETTTKKGRILKAFEDSDEEEEDRETLITDAKSEVKAADSKVKEVTEKTNEDKVNLQSQAILDSQDEDLQLAQLHKSFSEDLFTSQESGSKGQSITCIEEPDIGTQTFSIMNDATGSVAMDLDAPDTIAVISETQPNDDPSLEAVVGMCSGSFSQNLVDSQFPSTGMPVGEKLSVISETQPYDEPNLDAVVGMCSGSFSQNLVTSQPSESQRIGEDILNLCTGKFYDNQFVSQANEKDAKCNDNDASQIISDDLPAVIVDESDKNKAQTEPNQDGINIKPTQSKIQDDNNLKSILDELNDPEFEETKPKKYFLENTSKDISNTQYKKKFIIDSDDETNNDEAVVKTKKKIKKKKLEKRALQISDDEDEEEYDGEEREYMSDAEEEADRLVEYDSEENEVEVIPQKQKKKRKMAEFFEQEAELTSEDEWVGSGDEDERDLDRMEREEGDDDTFNQKKLQRELGQIHMRDVLDQDKREVRIIQELLFEDGDLGDGHRQRKFRWRNADGEEEGGPVPNEFADTQEEEMESEEQWRKQRHERELFLRQMQKEDEPEDGLNISINRTTIIKANLLSRTMSSLINEANKTASEANTTSDTDSPLMLEKKSSKDIPSPKRAFTVFQQSYHGSLLSRGRGALARLAALAAPLAGGGDDAPKQGALAPSSKRNFVFAALTPDDTEPKVTKRKAETNIGTPRLVKKMKTEDKKKPPRSSLLDHLKV